MFVKITRNGDPYFDAESAFEFVKNGSMKYETSVWRLATFNSSEGLWKWEGDLLEFSYGDAGVR
jgi:hypothetical protein